MSSINDSDQPSTQTPWRPTDSLATAESITEDLLADRDDMTIREVNPVTGTEETVIPAPPERPDGEFDDEANLYS